MGSQATATRSSKTAPQWSNVVAVPENASALLIAQRLLDSLTDDQLRRQLPHPILLHGPSGCGKSHLIETIIAIATTSRNSITLRLVPARELTHDQPEPTKWHSRPDDYRDCDLCIIEDVQHLPANDVVYFDALLDDRKSKNKPTLLSATLGPASMSKFPRRLTSRLAGGLVVAIEPLTRSSRRTLLDYHAGVRRLHLTDDALDWLAEQSTDGSIRPMLGQLDAIKMQSREVIGSLDTDDIRKLLETKPTQKGGPIARIVRRVAKSFNVTQKDVLGASRHKNVLLPRQVAMYLARVLTEWSFPKIAESFGGRNHTTVIHACRKIEKLMKNDAQLRQTIRDLQSELG